MLEYPTPQVGTRRYWQQWTARYLLHHTRNLEPDAAKVAAVLAKHYEPDTGECRCTVEDIAKQEFSGTTTSGHTKLLPMSVERVEIALCRLHACGLVEAPSRALDRHPAPGSSEFACLPAVFEQQKALMTGNT